VRRAKAARLLTTLPGVSDLPAQVMVAEIGVDMSRFPSAAHLISWTGLCPRNDESAGKRRSSRVRKGAPWLKKTPICKPNSIACAHAGELRTAISAPTTSPAVTAQRAMDRRASY
jgi:hypothetical protein